MLTEQQIQEMNERLTSLKSEKDKLLKERYDLLVQTEEELNAFFVEILGAKVKCDFTYDYDFIQSIGQDYKCKTYAVVRITELCSKRASFEYVTMTVKEDTPITFDMWSGKFTHEDAEAQAILLIALLMQVGTREVFKKICFTRLNNYDEMTSKIYKVETEISKIEYALKEHENEIKNEEAAAQIIEGAMFQWGKYKDWYLKVVKVSDKLVRCETYVDYRNYYFENDDCNALHYRKIRQFSKDEFITNVRCNYFKKVEEDLPLYKEC